MSISTNEYTFDLPHNRIAQTPASPRESAKLLVVDRITGQLHDTTVAQLPDFFTANDVVVVNNTKVFKARLSVRVTKRTGESRENVELFLIRPAGKYAWRAIGKPGKWFELGASIAITKECIASVVAVETDGTFIIETSHTSAQIITIANQFGIVPLPPYIETPIDDLGTYQTSYAEKTGSVAAPTAGFHLTQHIRYQLQQKGVTIYPITLHVGLGTFLPIKTELITEHKMHSEWVEIDEHISTSLMKEKHNGKNIISIGTTTTRALEGVANLHNGILSPYQNDISLFITPGFTFHIIDGLLTNFHLPKSTLLLLVSAFAGQQVIRNAYQYALDHEYRFYSFGDAMLIR